MLLGWEEGMLLGWIDSLGWEEGMLLGWDVGLWVGVAATSADSIDTSISKELAASLLNSSLLTTSLIVSDTPAESEEISYSTSRVYPSCSFKLLLEPVRAARI